MSAVNESIFTSIKELSIVRTALKKGIAATAYEYNLSIFEVNQIVSSAIQDHEDVVERHQNSISELRNLLNGGVSHAAANCSDDAQVWCGICLKKGHLARDCEGVDGCCKCSRVGHLGKDCPDDGCSGGGGRLCYYCGMRGYMAVCSLCGERGHLGKDCY